MASQYPRVPALQSQLEAYAAVHGEHWADLIQSRAWRHLIDHDNLFFYKTCSSSTGEAMLTTKMIREHALATSISMATPWLWYTWVACIA